MSYAPILNAMGNLVLMEQGGMALGLLTRNGVDHQTADTWLSEGDFSVTTAVEPAFKNIADAVQGAVPHFVRLEEGLHIIGDAPDVAWRHFDPFYMAKMPVTYGAFLGLAKASALMIRPHSALLRHPLYPAMNVSWNTVDEFAAWLSILTGELYRLPFEDEWERAARGDAEQIEPQMAELSPNDFMLAWDERYENAFVRSQVLTHGVQTAILNEPGPIQELLRQGLRLSAYRMYATDSGILETNNAHWSEDQASKVIHYEPSPAGLYGMTGNVYEMTRTRSGEPVLRGAYYGESYSWDLRIAVRNGPYDYPCERVGFRLLKEATTTAADLEPAYNEVIIASRRKGSEL